ncbi:MAG: hypothetical protein FJW40_19820 [Acidobacteria bacterium]|nr:hypothetical protein [Acidobacteriota bacterium]
MNAGAPQPQTSDPRAITNPGSRMIGPYRLMRRLGAGGMGSVFEAIHETTEVRVALKVLRGSTENPDWVRRFRVERDTLSRLCHPNIARMLDVGQTQDGDYYIVMDFIDGTHLDAWVQDTKPDLSRLLELFHQLCLAVEYAHSQRVLHRDLKPANVLVDSEGQVKLLDFGIAKLADHDFIEATQTRTALRMLSPAYSSPEQLRGQPLDGRADVYALGVMLYEMVSGERPYRLPNSDYTAMAEYIQSTDPGTLSDTLPEAVIRIIYKALHPTPERRYESPEGLASDIDRYLTGRTVLARADSRIYRLRRQMSRNKRPKILAGAAVLALLLGWAAWNPSLRVPALAYFHLNKTLRIETGNLRLVSTDPGPGGNGVFTATLLSEMTAAGVFEAAARGDYVITGGFYSSDQQPASLVQINLNLIEKASGTAVATAAETTPLAEFNGAVARILSRWAQDLAGDDYLHLPARPQAQKLRINGQTRFATFDLAGARNLASRALLAAPRDPQARALLARALDGMGHVQEALRASELALQLARAQGLDGIPRWEAEAAHAELTGNWTLAADLRVKMASQRVDTASMMWLVEALTQADRMDEAERYLKQLEQDWPSDSRGVLEVGIAEVARRRGQWPVLLDAARRISARGEQTGSLPFMAEGQSFEGSALRRMGDLAGAAARFSAAHSLFDRAGYRARAAGMLGELGDTQLARKQHEAALATLNSALRASIEAHAPDVEQSVLFKIGRLQCALGKLEAARGSLARALALNLRADERNARLSLTLGKIAWQMGDTREAGKRFADSLEYQKGAARRFNPAEGALRLGLTHCDAGEPGEALRQTAQAGPYALALETCAGIAAGRTAGLEDKLRTAISQTRKTGLRALYNYWLGELMLAEGRPAEAEVPFRDTLSADEEDDNPVQTVHAQSSLAMAFVRLGRHAADDGLIAAARRNVPGPQFAADSLLLDRAQAYLALARGDANARRLMEDVRERADKLDWRTLSQEAAAALDGKL